MPRIIVVRSKLACEKCGHPLKPRTVIAGRCRFTKNDGSMFETPNVCEFFNEREYLFYVNNPRHVLQSQSADIYTEEEFRKRWPKFDDYSQGARALGAGGGAGG
jgi:hypothetical protein